MGEWEGCFVVQSLSVAEDRIDRSMIGHRRSALKDDDSSKETHRLTPRNLPHPPLSDTKILHWRSQIHRDPTIKHKKYHLHFPRILDSLDASRR